MRILAVDASVTPGSVALLEDDHTVLAQFLPGDQRTAQSLVSITKQMFAQLGWEISSLDLIGTTQGPGSFTGLRIASTFAKTLAYALDCPISGVSSLASVALDVIRSCERWNWNNETRSKAVWAKRARIRIVMDAQRKQYFVQDFGWSEDELSSSQSQFAIWSSEPLLDFSGDENGSDNRESGGHLSATRHELVWSGPGLKQLEKRHPQIFATNSDDPNGTTQIGPTDLLVPRAHWLPLAENVARLASVAYAQGAFADHLTFLPNYGRASAAEEKRASS